MQGAIDNLYPEMDEMELTGEDWDDINNQIFLCEQCEWWCESSESSEDDEGCFGDVCTDCAESQNE